jgi:hypothetical protein
MVTLLITIVDGLPQHVCTVSIRLVVRPAPVIPVAWRKIFVSVHTLETQLILTDSLKIPLLIAYLRHPPLPLQQYSTLLFQPLLLRPLLSV